MLERIAGGIDRAIDALGRAVSWLTLAVVLLTFGVVVLRYAFDQGSLALQDLVLWLHGAVFLVGASYALRHDAHVRVDILYQRFGPKAKAWTNLIGVLIFLIPGCLMIVMTSWHFVSRAFVIGEGSPDPGGIPYRFLVKGLMPVGFGLLLLQGISLGIHSLLQILGLEKIEESGK